MRLYLYFKVDRGYYESAYATWRAEGGSFDTHLLRAQATLYTWQREFERAGCEIVVDTRSSFILPQTRRASLPLSVARVVRAMLWGTRLDPWLLQRDLIRRIAAYKPDAVFIPLGSSIWESTLNTLKQHGVKLFLWCGLPVRSMSRRDRITLPYFDLIFQPANFESRLRTAGVTGRIEYLPLAVDPEVYHPIALTPAELSRFESDVCFIGSLDRDRHRARRALIEYAIKQGVRMKIWGGYREQFVGSPIMEAWHQQVWGADQVKALCGTKIGLNIHLDHATEELQSGLNLRAFELPSCGVMQLLKRVPGLPEFFQEDREIVCFETREEMVDKIKYYLAHDTERAQLAEAGRARVLRDHTWGQRIRQMLHVLNELCGT